MTVNLQKRRRYRLSRTPAIKSAEREPSAAVRLFLTLSFIAASGVLTGAFSRIYGSGYQLEFSDRTTADIFMRSFISVGLYVFICFLSGFSSVGQPVGYILPFFKGTGAGWLAADVFSGQTYELPALISILPFEALSMVAVILAARENIRMSSLTARCTFGSGVNTSGAFKLYLLKFLIIMLISLAAAAADAAASLL